MASEIHPLAKDHPLPSFVTAPGEVDTLLVVAGAILLIAVLAVGLIFLRLHTLPERMAHKSQKIQFEFVAVLGLLALFTGVHIFWVAGLLLALIDIPNFSGYFGRIAHALERLAGIALRQTVRGEGDPNSDNELSTVQSERSAISRDPGAH
jgi:hypothetical protein